MRKIPICKQKGLRIYVATKAVGRDNVRYGAILANNEQSITVPILKQGPQRRGTVVSIPANITMDALYLEVKERHTGKTVEKIDLSNAKLLSRISRLAPETLPLLKSIDELNLQNPLHRRQYDMNLDDCFDTLGGDVVWRIAIDWRGSLKSKPRLELIGSDLGKIDVGIHEFEFQEGLFREGCTVNRLIATFRIPRSLADFSLFAHDPQREIISNFYPMDSVAATALIDERSAHMQSVDDQQELYPRWLESHLDELQDAESDHCSTCKDSLHIIVFDNKESERMLAHTLDSLKQQHYDGWHATVLGHAAEALKESGDRISMVSVPDDADVSNAVKEIAQETTASHICLVEAGDVFSAGALEAMANASDGTDAVIAFDEDSIDDIGAHSHPRFKGPLNKQLEYTENWIGYGALFPKKLFNDTPLEGLESPSLIAYALTLTAMEKGLSFDFLPFVLLDTPCDAPGSLTLGFLPEEIDAAKRLLSHHLGAIGAHATVQDGLLCGTLKISLADANQGKVSIIIPTMDHAEMLGQCVSSLLGRATYQDIEIILIENNSTEAETFALYETLQKENPGVVKVVTWDGPFNYSGIINFGVAASSGRFLLLLNNDTEVIVPSFIEEMLALATIPEVGVVGAKLYFKDMLVQHAGMLIGPYGGISHVNQNFSDIRPGYQNRALTTCSFSSVTGACQMVRREVFDEVGGYDDTFVVGFNDADFCLKVRAAGYDVVFTPYAELYHYEFVSRGREAIDDTKQTRWENERDAFFGKWEDALKNGDPLTNPNLDKDNWYYALGTTPQTP